MKSMKILIAAAIMAGGVAQGHAQDTGSGNLRVGYTVAPTALDPATVPSAVLGLPYLMPIYDRLMNLGPDGQPIAMLATAWAEAEDGMTWTIDLREGVTFSDGAPFNAEAAKANLERYKSDGSEKSLLAAVQSIEIVDDNSLKLVMERRDNLLPLTLVGLAGAMASPASFGDLATKPVGAGPYVLSEALSDRIVYKRREGYWDPSAQKVESLEIIGVGDTNARINGVAAGQIDMTFLSASEVESAKSVTNNPDFAITAGKPNPGHWILFLNTRTVTDARVRKAVSVSLDRKTMSQAITGGVCAPAAQTFSPGSAGFVEEFATDEYLGADPDAARQLLADAGATAPELNIIVIPVATSNLYGQVIQAELAKVGIKVNLVTVPTPQAFPTYLKGEHDGLILTVDGQLDPGLVVRYAYTGSRNLGEAPAEVVALAEKAAGQALGSPERDETFQEINRFLMEKPVHVPLCTNRTTILNSNRVTGLDDLGLSNFVTNTVDVRNFGIK